MDAQSLEQESKEAIPPPSVLASLILTFYFLVICIWFYGYFSTEPIPSWDLPGHIAITERLRMQLSEFRIFFYDRWWFSGWPAFQFYSFLPHVFAAIVSIPFSVFTPESVRLSVHILLVLGVATLPVSLYFASITFLREIVDEGCAISSRVKMLLAFLSGSIAFWFLNHDGQWYGLGAASVMNVGLFSQVFSWHFLLMYLASLCSLHGELTRRKVVHSIIWGFLLLITHQLTAFYSFFILFLFWCHVGKRRFWYFISGFFSIALSAFWVFPYAALSKEYTAFDIYRPTGDFLELFFRYPLSLLFQNIDSWMKGIFRPFDPTQLFIYLLFVIFCLSKQARRAKSLYILFVFSVLATVVFSSGFVATSLPLGLHYYRFLAYIFLTWLLVLIPVPLLAFSKVEEGALRVSGVVSTVVVVCCVASLVASIFLPHYERAKIIANKGFQNVQHEEAVISYLRNQSDIGRVFVEYATDDDRSAYLGPHYIESRLSRATGLETINGLFVQSAIGYRMAVVSANLLGAKTYNGPLLFTDRAELQDETKVEQLKDFGVTHVVSVRNSFSERIKKFAKGEVVTFGNLAVTKIGSKQPLLTYPKKILVGYADFREELPFNFLEYFIYARDDLYRTYEVLEVSGKKILPKEVQVLLINGEPITNEQRMWISDLEKEGIKVLKMHFERNLVIDHYHVRYQHNVELDSYNDAEYYLGKIFDVKKKLSELELKTLTSAVEGNLEFSFYELEQTMKLSGMQPGTLARINYSYFPFWSSKDGTIFKGSGERMYFLPKHEKATLQYGNLNVLSARIGWAVTGLSLLLMIAIFKLFGLPANTE